VETFGEKIMTHPEFIPILKPRLPNFEAVAPFLRRMDASNIYSNRGPLVRELEEKYAQLFNVSPENVVAVSNATLALQGCITISEPKKWRVPNFTFAATGLAVKLSGKELLLEDVSEKDWQIAIEPEWHLDESIGLLPVLPFGAPLDTQVWKKFNHVVIDAAASLGAETPSLADLPKNWFVVYSLHATKVFGAGEGAFVICGDEFNAQRLRSWINFGFNGARVSEILGTNAKMSEVSAAYALASYAQRELETIEWELVLSKASLHSQGLSTFSIVSSFKGIRPYWIIQTNSSIEKSRLINHLKSMNIDSRSWWTPLNLMDAFKENRTISSPITYSLSDQTLGLPMWRDLKPAQIERIIAALDSFTL
jgi:dTDP-4-amino-4,6-dideoxygalactose transaminase